MTEAIIVGLIAAGASIFCTLYSAKATRDKMASDLDTRLKLTDNEIGHIKTDMDTMRTDIKEHNHYARLFSETMPVVQEQIKVINHRIEDLEKETER